ncbi:endolytic transglycosylase MltG [Streptococcus gallolyticus]|nr:endolytic transglycosylase MltG [Streptococcus gallolyticus]MBY5040183.1 endolytic transglycosylase MltG [Streptococcus gallolyticus]
MADNLENKDTQKSSFRDQILRDLEQLKQERLAQQPAEETMPSVDDLRKRFDVDRVEMDKTPAKAADLLLEETSEKPLVEQVSEDSVEEIPEEVIETATEIQEVVPNFEREEVAEPISAVDNEEVASEIPAVEEVVPVLSEEQDLDATVVHHFSMEGHEAALAEATTTLEETLVSPVSVAEESEKASRKHARSRASIKQHRKKQEKTATRIVMTVVTVVLLAVALTGVAGYAYVKSSLEPINTKATKTLQIEIPEGSTTLEIGKILEKNNLIKNATIFNYYAKLKSYNNFQSGFYNLSQSMSVDELSKALQESGTATPQEPIAGKVLIIEGSTIKQIAQAMTNNVNTKKTDDKTPFTSEDFLKLVADEAFIQKMAAAYPKLFASLPAADSGVLYRLEGYLFPATYEYTDSTTVEEMVEKMIAAMDERLKPYYDQLAAKGLDVNSLLTMASLVEKEGSTDEDRRTIAGVFYNRINAGMPLQSNIAILYAMGKLGEKTTLAEDATIDTNIDSPYNIYTNTGLMPGPVDSPSQAAIEATFNPNKTNNYYFVADVKTGTVYYSETLEQHEQNVATYVNSQINN